MTKCRKPAKDLGLLFKTDAKAEKGLVVLGGWECKDGTPTEEARWFSVALTATEAPWLFSKGHASRTVASSELLATLVAVWLFVPVPEEGTTERTRGLMRCRGHTDNIGNSYVVAKLLTTKFPLAAVLMQLATTLAERDLWLELQWVPREENTEADALTNSEFKGFDPGKRCHLVWSDIPKDVLAELVNLGEKFASELELRKEAKRSLNQTGTGTRRKKKRKLLQPW
jgi:hypothetical protein